ncbi:MAG: autotransporter-associated beta strand repeat-containing protein, partial [Kiritimatiellae bacterium]|nr:autotransporter-associated beta strand repeat-containing protein [Kiritimatiellia bacterium]
MKSFVSCVSVLSMLTFSVNAAEIDLAGEPLTATDLTADYVNNSDTAATLTFDVSEDATFSGSISGNISVVKIGSATLTLPSANTYMGGTTISNGLLSISSDDAFGSGGVHFVGGGVHFTETTNASKIYSYEA